MKSNVNRTTNGFQEICQYYAYDNVSYIFSKKIKGKK